MTTMLSEYYSRVTKSRFAKICLNEIYEFMYIRVVNY